MSYVQYVLNVQLCIHFSMHSCHICEQDSHKKRVTHKIGYTVKRKISNVQVFSSDVKVQNKNICHASVEMKIFHKFVLRYK